MRTSCVLVFVAALTGIPVIAAAQATPTTPAAGQATQKPASPAPAGQANQKPAAPPAAEDAPEPYVAPPKNRADFGVRFTSVDGDAARYERYRDLRTGPVLESLRYSKASERGLFDAAIDHLGYRDQKYAASFIKPGVVKAWGFWDQIPMLLSQTTQTLFLEGIAKQPNVMTIDDGIQSSAQANSANLGPLFDANAITFTTESWRHIAQGGVEFLPSQDVTLRAKYQFTHRQGTLPYGGSFGHSVVVEMPAPIDQKTTDFNTSAEYVRGPWFFSGGFNGSWFTNENTTVTWDNPWRVSDASSTPAHGRASLAPSNSFLTVNGMVGVKMPMRSRLTAYVSTGSLKDVGDPLMPQTINTSNTNIGALPRNTVSGEARTNTLNLTFTSRPGNVVDIDARYRIYDYANNTPEFVLQQRVSYDNTPNTATFTTLGGTVSPLVVETEPFGIKRTSFDTDVRFRMVGTPGVGYSYYGEDRSHRFFEATHESVFRASYDLISAGLFSFRSKYEHGARRADVADAAELALYNIGEQPEMRQFDIAQRNRDRVTLLGTFTPPDGTMVLSGSIAEGRDDYLETTFGLRDNKHHVYTAGADFIRSELVSYGASYSYENYNALQRSRQANPPSPTITYDQFLVENAKASSPIQVADATRNWGSEGVDRVHSIIFRLDLTGLKTKWDLHFNYDYNRSRSTYVYTTGPDVPRTLPEDVPPPTTTLPPPTQLPEVKSDLNRATTDILYALTPKLSLGVSWWFEKWTVQDFTLDADANSDLVRGQALLLGYMYRPYTGNTGWVRLMYRW